MKKIYIGFVFIPALVFGLGVVSASAATLQWLAESKTITTALESEGGGQFTLGATNGLGLKIVALILCSGTFEGSVGPGTEAIITTVLNLAKEAVTLSKPLSCLSVETCEGLSTAEAVNLPWLTHLELMGTEAEQLFLEVLGPGNGLTGTEGNPGWTISCKTALGTAEETCTIPNLSANLTNDVAEDVLGLFEHEEIPPGTCSIGGTFSGSFESSASDEPFLFMLTVAETLSVSYE